MPTCYCDYLEHGCLRRKLTSVIKQAVDERHQTYNTYSRLWIRQERGPSAHWQPAYNYVLRYCVSPFMTQQSVEEANCSNYMH